MQMRGNTILITGGTSGIGQGLATAFHQRGNQVIITGRREERLKEICRQHSGMSFFVLDVTSATAIREIARKVIQEFPSLNCVINNAGVQMRIQFSAEQPLDEQSLQAEIDTNLLGPMRVTAAFLPHLVKQTNPTLMNVSSGLAFVPIARFPVYCATKAAIHSWTMSLRQQLRSSGVKVIEIIPPWVATELGGPGKPTTAADGRRPMPLDAFIAETISALETDADEIAVGDASKLFGATSPDTVRRIFAGMNA